MKKLCCVALGLALARPVLAGEAIGFAFATDHADALYKVGEEAVFTVTATNGAGAKVSLGTVRVRVDNYGPKVLSERTVDLAKGNPFVVKGKLDEPGFLRVTMSGEGVGQKNSRWGVGYDPTHIVAGGTVPADFDRFWADAQARLEATVPLDPRLELQPDLSTGAYDYYRASFATYGGTRVWGFLSIPKDRTRAPFPVTCEVCSAGEGNWTIGMTGRPDRIRFYFTVHSFEPPRTLAEVAPRHAQLRADLKARYGVGYYASAGIAVSREEYYFYRTILGINRAFNWLWQQDYVDRRHFDYSGGSQGGAFGWCLCGLNRKITSAVLRVPAMSDMLGYKAGRISGWPGIVEAQPAAQKARAAENAAYFDGASFATRITCPIRVTVGFIDNICPPPTVYATYNRLASEDKAIFNAIGKGHGGETHAVDEVARRWQEGAYEPILDFEVQPAGRRADPAEQAVTAPTNMTLFLLMGQSNMAGRAPVPEALRTLLPRVYKLNRNDRWVAAASPIHFDRNNSGVGPVDAFVRDYLADHPGETVGLVPCAVGGSAMVTWIADAEGTGRPGSNFRRALARAKVAAANGRFAAILWHQGESDACRKDADVRLMQYAARFRKMVGTLRRELVAPDLPVLVGELGPYLADGRAEAFNPIVRALSDGIPHCACVSAAGLTPLKDNLHFNFESVMILGHRYYEAYRKF